MPERVLITGAGGFIGGRIAEMLYSSGIYQVRAGVRRWSSAARIARFPMEIVVADVTKADSMRDAMRGVDAVVNCAVGDGAVNRGSISIVLEAAKQAGVKRVVHLSTVSVYGEQVGVLDEALAIAHSGNEYGDSKLDAERTCWEYGAAGLPVIALRPTLVYGPFSENWTVEFAQRMVRGPWMLPRDDCEGTCNLVFVDDLVAGVICALRSQTGLNEAYNINGPELDITWNEYFDALNHALGLPPLHSKSRWSARMTSAALQPVRTSAKFLLNRFEGPIMALYQKNALAKALMRKAESMIRQTPTSAEFVACSRVLSFPTTKAERLLGYRPRITMREGVAASAAWIRHHRILQTATG